MTGACSTSTHAPLRYASCWEDAEVMREALAVRPGRTVLSIASAGDNTLALLAGDPERVVAVDSNPAQLACLELRVAAWSALEYEELLAFLGSRPCADRLGLYRRCRPLLSPAARAWWDAHRDTLPEGVGNAGRLERYFGLFRRLLLPMLEGRRRVAHVLAPCDPVERTRFFAEEWDRWPWRLGFRLFFSRRVMSLLGRDPAYFAQARGDVATRLRARVRHALVDQDPSRNPYLHWLLRGCHGDTLPFALEPEPHARIRRNLDRLDLRQQTLAACLAELPARSVDAFNLSDLFEYLTPEETARHLARIAEVGRPGARLVYWNLLVDRRRPDALADRIRPLTGLAERLHRRDRVFFYRRVVVEEVRT